MEPSRPFAHCVPLALTAYRVCARCGQPASPIQQGNTLLRRPPQNRTVS